MSNSEIQKARAQVARLRQEIEEHNRRYYVEAAPAVSDYEYDQLYRELARPRSEVPRTRHARFPDPARGRRADGRLRAREASPADAFAGEGRCRGTSRQRRGTGPREAQSAAGREHAAALLDFDNTIRKHLGRDRVEYVMEPKVDGVSIGVHYRHGKLALGVTRGDGQSGDDITANLRTVRAIPLELESEEPARAARSARRGLHRHGGFRGAERETRSRRREDLPQRPQRHRRHAQATRPAPRRAAPDQRRVLRRRRVRGHRVRDARARCWRRSAGSACPRSARWWVCQDIEEVLQRLPRGSRLRLRRGARPAHGSCPTRSTASCSR